MKSVYLLRNINVPIYVGVSNKPNFRFLQHLDMSPFIELYEVSNLNYVVIDADVHDRYAFWLEKFYYDELTADGYVLHQARPHRCRTGLNYSKFSNQRENHSRT